MLKGRDDHTFDPEFVVVIGALEWEVIAHVSLLWDLTRGLLPIHDLDDFGPDRALTGKHLSISKDIKSSFGTGQCHTYSIIDRKKSDLVFLVAPDQRK